MEKQPQLFEFQRKGDERGYLVAIEGKKDIPFDIKRIFYIYGSDDSVVRGKHANQKSEFILINVSGSCEISVDIGDGEKQIFSLDKSNCGVYLPNMVWKEMYNFSSDSVLLCLASEYYDVQEYVKDYDEFVALRQDSSSNNMFA